jgi:hypothetical protein
MGLMRTHTPLDFQEFSTTKNGMIQPASLLFAWVMAKIREREYCGVFTPCKNCNIETRSRDYATVDEAVFSPCHAESRRERCYAALR